MLNSNYRVRNDVHLKFVAIVNIKGRLDFLVVEVAAESAISYYFSFILF